MSDKLWDKVLGLYAAGAVTLLWLYILGIVVLVVGGMCLLVIGVPALVVFFSGMFLGG